MINVVFHLPRAELICILEQLNVRKPQLSYIMELCRCDYCFGIRFRKSHPEDNIGNKGCYIIGVGIDNFVSQFKNIIKSGNKLSEVLL